MYTQPKVLQEYIKKSNFVMLDQSIEPEIYSKGKYLFDDPFIRKAFHSGDIELYRYKNHYYYKFKIKDKVFWVKNKASVSPYNLYVLLFSLVIGTALVLIYHYISRGIQPLKDLYNEIIRFSNGESNINTKNSNSDEVAVVANAFHMAVQKIERLEEGRKLIMRTIMHELNTPLTQGKILLPMLNVDHDDKNELTELFTSMQGHLKRLQHVDAITRNELTLSKKKYALIDILDNIFDILDIDEACVTHNIEKEQVYVDFNLFSSALQNLIGNAMKYSKDKKIYISFCGNRLFIINEAPALEEKFDLYTKPFKRGAQDSHGMGLGLYISKEILHHHGFDLLHKYLFGKHFVCIRFDSKTTEDLIS